MGDSRLNRRGLIKRGAGGAAAAAVAAGGVIPLRGCDPRGRQLPGVDRRIHERLDYLPNRPKLTEARHELLRAEFEFLARGRETLKAASS